MHTLLCWQRDTFQISTDNNLLDIDAIHKFLTQSTWAKGINKETVHLAINNSLNFGLYENHKQIGFARLVTDYTTFAYLCDVYIIDEYQKRGLARWLIECLQSHPVCRKLRRMMLVTSTAPGLYEKCGFLPENKPNFVWAICRDDTYHS